MNEQLGRKKEGAGSQKTQILSNPKKKRRGRTLGIFTERTTGSDCTVGFCHRKILDGGREDGPEGQGAQKREVRKRHPEAGRGRRKRQGWLIMPIGPKIVGRKRDGNPSIWMGGNKKKSPA